MSIDFRDSMAVPNAVDIGNISIQGRVVSKTIKLASFTTNANAVRAGRQALLKESYPFAFISFTANRDVFRYEVGDCFKFSYAQYGIYNMICRVLQIEEAELGSEIITIHAMEDIFSVNNPVTVYEDPEDHTIDPIEYDIEPLTYQNVIESLYVTNGNTIGIIPVAIRSSDNQLGYELFMSSDGGNSYKSLGTFGNFSCKGILTEEYSKDTHQIDDDTLLQIRFTDYSNIEQFETITRQEMLGASNLVLIDNEIMTIQNIDPLGGTWYNLSGIYRGRFDTQKEDHAMYADIILTNGDNIQVITNADIVLGTSRKFKFVPYNSKKSADIADCPVVEITIEGRARKPYCPINFKANGFVNDPVYSDDVLLTWSPRIRGGGAGYFVPSITDSSPTWEGFFKIEVWVSGTLVRTEEKVDALEWTYTEAMNLADNGSLATQITFKLINFIEYSEWPDAEADAQEIIVTKE